MKAELQCSSAKLLYAAFTSRTKPCDCENGFPNSNFFLAVWSKLSILFTN